MSKNQDQIVLEPEEIEAAYAWHDGQYSMLYAAASTGALARGTVRPSEYLGDCRHRPLTDREWIVSLAERLEGEASWAADEARERAEDPSDYDDPDELLDQASALDAIAAKCRALIGE